MSCPGKKGGIAPTEELAQEKRQTACQCDPMLMLMKSWQQQGLNRESMMQGERPNAVAVLFPLAHKLALPKSAP